MYKIRIAMMIQQILYYTFYNISDNGIILSAKNIGAEEPFLTTKGKTFGGILCLK